MPIPQYRPGLEALRNTQSGGGYLGPPVPLDDGKGDTGGGPGYLGPPQPIDPPQPVGNPGAQTDPRRRQLMMDRLRGWAQGQRAQRPIGRDDRAMGPQQMTQVEPTPGYGPGIVQGMPMPGMEPKQEERPLVMAKPGMPQAMPKPGFGNKPMMLPGKR